MKAIKELVGLLDDFGAPHYEQEYLSHTEVWAGGETDGGGGAKFTAYEQLDGLICVELADLTPKKAAEIYKILATS